MGAWNPADVHYFLHVAVPVMIGLQGGQLLLLLIIWAWIASSRK